jgi:hypothetical protein
MITTDDFPACPDGLEERAHVNRALPATAIPLASPAMMMAVVDADGYLIPLCTAGDLLRLCKVAWNAERD